MRFLLAVDGSESSAHATEFVNSLVRPGDFVIVYTSRPVPGSTVLEAGVAQVKLPAAEKSGHADVHDPREGVVQMASEAECDLVVCGSRGHGLLKRSLLGSVSSSIVSNCQRPVLVVHGPLLESQNTWLLCADATEGTKHAATLLAKIAQPADEIVLWHGVVPPPLVSADQGFAWQELLQATEAEAARTLQSVREVLVAGGVAAEQISTKVEAAAEPRDAALDFAEAKNVKAIVCGSRGLGAVQRFVFGSFSSYLAQHAKQAVLVVR
eukprot:TRINITY_DN95341_c0_g1_i1.p1 TRINITY_DN95341_c0_g1~~TRINITY_DN95341_c0_g1_i1.p1  ORF type:complete len:275 (+),score=42.69 TRINITY_DN95341_c0_g1_i1:26-826(+)